MSQRVIEVDVAVIGAGSAGLVARRQALNHGAKRVMLIEGGPYGTTCARVGCMPSKLLIAAADAAARVREAEPFGVRAGTLEIDGEAVMARVRRERDRFASFVVESTERIDASDRLRGWARFVGPSALEVALGPGVDDETAGGETVRVEARAVVVAAGSSPSIPPPLRNLGERVLTSDSVFDLDTLPRSLAVVGTGVIGLELGQAMHRLGVETRIFDIATRMPLVSSEVMQAEARALFGERLDLHMGIDEMRAKQLGGPDDGSIHLRWKDADGSDHEAAFEYVLAATGRRPQLARLELANAGVALDERGMPKHWDERTGQIADTPIFLAGDVTGTRPLLHEAAAEGRIAGINAALFPEVRAHVRYTPMGIMFTDPNVAIVGEIPGDATREGEDWEVGEIDYAKQGRARVINQSYGRTRIYARRRCGTIFAAEMIGPGVEHMAHLLAWSIQQGLTAPQLRTMPYYHPVLEEGLRTAVHELARKLKMADEPRPLDCGPGV